MAKIIHTGGGTFVDTEPVAAPDGVDDDPDVRVYAYARFRSLEHVAYGLFRTTGGPEDEELGSEKVGEYGMEPIAPYWDFNDALKELEREGTHRLFEEVPYVDVDSEDSYNEALEAMGYDPEDTSWPSDYQEPGLYDFRDDPPSYVSSVEEYELESMTDAADQAIEFMFQGDEWKEAYGELAEAEEDE